MDESIPETQPDGALTPPPRVPPIAIATAAPQPPQRPTTPLRVMRRDWRSLVNRALDRLDTIADDIAGLAGRR